MGDVSIKGRSPLLKGGRVGLKEGTPYRGSRKVSRETYEEAKKDIKDIKGKVHAIKAHTKEGEKRLKELRRKQDWQFVSEKTLKEVYPERDKGWEKKKKIEHNAQGGRVGKRHGGGVGIQTHGNKLAKPLNTQTPDHSVYLNEDNYLKGGIKIRS